MRRWTNRRMFSVRRTLDQLMAWSLLFFPKSNAQGLQFARRRRERDPDSILKKNRLCPIRNAIMHHRTIPVPLDLLVQTLMVASPLNVSLFRAAYRPIAKAFKLHFETLGAQRRDKINECIAKTCIRTEVHRHVHEIKEGMKPIGIERLH